MSFPTLLFRARRLRCFLSLGLLFASTSRGSLLIYEGFDYTAGSTLNAITPNASTIGFDQSTAYAGTNVGNYTVQSGSLTFGSLQTTGGSVAFPTGTSVASGKLSLASSYTGTLWSSYLVTLSTRSTSLTTDGALMRISDSTGNAGERFNSFADSRSGSTNVAVGYDATSTSTGNPLTLSTTYIIIAKFTNVGTGLTTTTTGQSSIWALTEAQFGNFILGGGTEAYLNSATVTGTATGVTARGSDANVTSGTYSLTTGNFAALVAVNDVGAFDELRFGTTLVDVTPIPEPAALGVIAGASVLAGSLLRRRRAIHSRHQAV